MRKQGDYTYTVVRDKDRQIIGLLLRHKNDESIIIPLIDIILLLEKEII